MAQSVHTYSSTMSQDAQVIERSDIRKLHFLHTGDHDPFENYDPLADSDTNVVVPREPDLSPYALKTDVHHVIDDQQPVQPSLTETRNVTQAWYNVYTIGNYYSDGYSVYKVTDKFIDDGIYYVEFTLQAGVAGALNEIGERAVQPDWYQSNSSKPDYIKNKPNINDYQTIAEAYPTLKELAAQNINVNTPTMSLQIDTPKLYALTIDIGSHIITLTTTSGTPVHAIISLLNSNSGGSYVCSDTTIQYYDEAGVLHELQYEMNGTSGEYMLDVYIFNPLGTSKCRVYDMPVKKRIGLDRNQTDADANGMIGLC